MSPTFPHTGPFTLLNINIIFGPSGVRALPVAAGTNVVAIVLGIIGPSVLPATSGLAEQLRETIIGPSVLRATSGLAEQLR